MVEQNERLKTTNTYYFKKLNFEHTYKSFYENEDIYLIMEELDYELQLFNLNENIGFDEITVSDILTPIGHKISIKFKYSNWGSQKESSLSITPQGAILTNDNTEEFLSNYIEKKLFKILKPFTERLSKLTEKHFN